MLTSLKNILRSGFKLIQLIGKPSLIALTFIVTSLSRFSSWILIFRKKISLILKKTTKKLTKKLKKQFKKTKSKLTLLKKIKPKKLKKRKPHKSYKKPLKYIIGISLLSVIVIELYLNIFKDLPSVNLLSDSLPSLSTKIYDRNGELLYQIYKDQNRSLISLKNLPQYVINATISAEDKNFYHHSGIDLTGIARAALNNLRCYVYSVPCSLQGGSTITQQLVKNTLLSPEKTFTRKVKEFILALEVEFRYSKDQILEMYLNQVSYGGTAYGIEEASQQYFGKSAKDLNLAESAMLAGLPISPTVLSPFGTNPYLGKIRQQQVLENMVQTKSITEDEKNTALSTPLEFNSRGITIRAPHFVMYIKDLLVKQFGEELVARGGLEVKTTLDLKYQDILQSEINKELLQLNKLHVQNGAGLIVNPKNGEILAMVGSKDFFDSTHDGQVNIVLQQRQPGSSIKPITYALAFSSGMSPYSTIDDSPICFALKGQPSYCPKNYDGRFHGKVSLRTALASSYNIPAIKLLNTYGIKNMIELAKKMGITTWEDSSRFGLSLTLGGGEITMLDLASVYSVFANDGTKIPFTSITSVKDSKGLNLVLGDSPPSSSILSPSIAYQINSILSDPFARAPSFGLNSVLNLPGKNVAVKTGTTNNLRDNWTFGYTKNILVATWVGNNDNSPMSSVVSGITGASPIWAHTMQLLLKNDPPTPFVPPESMIKVNVACLPSVRFEYFIPGTAPKIDCRPKDESGQLLEKAASTSQ